MNAGALAKKTPFHLPLRVPGMMRVLDAIAARHVATFETSITDHKVMQTHPDCCQNVISTNAREKT